MGLRVGKTWVFAYRFSGEVLMLALPLRSP